MVKLISKIEYEMITINMIDYVDTFHPGKYIVGDIVSLRCYFAQRYEVSVSEIYVKVLDVVSISFNMYSKLTLYRMYFERI